MFVEPGHDLTIDGIDKAVTQTQSVLNVECRALDMKAGAGPQFARVTNIEPPWQVVTTKHIPEAEFVREVRRGFFQTVEVIANGEMLGHIAFPRRHRAAIRLGPIRHQLCPYSRSIAATWSRPRMRAYIFIALSRL